MKNILKIFIIAAGFVLFFNVNSFALVDVAAWGGYVFKGDADGVDFDSGGQYGFKGHYNTSLVPLFDLGIGAYYQYSKLKFDKFGFYNFSRKTAGFDVNFILSLPIIHPYVRGTWAFMDKVESVNKRFKTYGIGAGVELGFLPFISLFGEYMYEKSNHKYADITSNAVNFGLKLDI